MRTRTINRRHLLFLAILVALACAGIDRIEVEEQSSTTVDQGSILEQFVGDLGFGNLVAFDINETEEFQNQGAKKEEIDSIRLTLLRLEVTDPPSGQDFTFIDDLEFYVEAEGLPRVRIARGGPFPADEMTVEMELDDVDLKPYATAPSMDITTEASGNRPQNDTTILGTIRFVVDVNVSGVVCGK